MKKINIPLRLQAVLDLLPAEDAKKALSEWRKNLKKMERIDEVEIYPHLLVKKQNGYGFA